MGPEVRAFETELTAFGKAPLVLFWANGTGAVVLPRMAWLLGESEAVFN